ncbi:serine hydrolase domain-containing protein [Primorskyibacter sp. 2E233]|uniref:serine hydrolase domain-containing protein n=1 Tax=Primorskyibacter sp. 2E233 TaxID=3413431 RepID=UPI003BF0AC4A
MWKRIGKGFVLLLLLIAAMALWKREELQRLNAVNTLFSEEKIVYNFSHMDRLFNAVPIPVEGVPTPLPHGRPIALPDDWQDWQERRAVTGVVILKDGAVVHEAYRLGTKAEDRRISWSMAKSYLSALLGVLLDKGDVDSLDDPVTQYAPELIGSAYDGATIRNVLQMSSGVEFDEDYLDFWSDINKMGRVLALGGSMDGFAAGLDQRYSEPGTHWHYVSIDTHVLGMVVRGATGKPLPDLMAEFILTPLGTYADPYFVTDGYGVAFALGGLNLTTRDYARLGELFRGKGAFQGRQIVPADWAVESTRPSAPTATGALKYGYQWWIPEDAREGEFMARGVYGQYIYIDQSSGTVIAINAADRNFRDKDAFSDSLQMFRRLAQILEAR